MININELSKSVTTPAICRDADDFLKFVMAWMFTSYANSKLDIPPEIQADGLRNLLHDYLALTLQGKIEPFEVTKNEEEVEAFREVSLIITQRMMNNTDIPFKEENGRIKFDLPGMFKGLGRDLNNAIDKELHGKD